MTLTLCEAVNARSAAVRWMLEELGQPYEVQLTNPDDAEHDEKGYSNINPTGKVPALRHQEMIITEAGAICCYLADTFPDVKLNVPVDDPRRGAYLEWLYLGPGSRESELFTSAVLDRIAKMVELGPWLFGEQFTAADVVVGTRLSWGMMIRTIPQRPQFLAYTLRLAQRPALQRVMTRRPTTSRGVLAKVKRAWSGMATPLCYTFPEPAVLDCPPAREGHGLAPTEAVMEGPYYVPETPQREILRDAHSVGQSLILEGHVLRTDGRPVGQAVIDVWSCDANGKYDEYMYDLRGHRFTAPDGSYRFEMVKPGTYFDALLGRLRSPHIHVKIQGRDTALLTTQLYFPNEPSNAQDILFKTSLVVALSTIGDNRLRAQFNFVLPSA